ncbi:MAG: MBL fold metallo-hydrolase [Acidobacteriota bacterium]|nr:MBL fold metallo-hydrolase [Acidobacteriota bacterium]
MIRLIALLALFAASLPAARNLEIYIIDVEGGKSVLVVSPPGQSMLFDAGWTTPINGSASNDRIVEAVRAAGLKRIDFLVISHFDIDHIGNVAQLASRIPIGHIFDHGEVQVTQASAAAASQRFAPYAAIREKIGHTTVKPGDKIPIKGIDVQVLSAAGKLITKPVPHAGASNPACGSYKQAEALASDVEDNQSVGLLIISGKFRMLDLADLEAHYSHNLVCPDNLIGAVDVYNVNVHGQFKGIAPELVSALRAPVMIQANGATKGADAQTWPVLRDAPGLRDIWQLHYSLKAGPNGNPPNDFIANPNGKDGFKWIKISAARDGSFTVTNSRNGFSKHYTKSKALTLNKDAL